MYIIIVFTFNFYYIFTIKIAAFTDYSGLLRNYILENSFIINNS